MKDETHKRATKPLGELIEQQDCRGGKLKGMRSGFDSKLEQSEAKDSER